LSNVLITGGRGEGGRDGVVLEAETLRGLQRDHHPCGHARDAQAHAQRLLLVVRRGHGLLRPQLQQQELGRRQIRQHVHLGLRGGAGGGGHHPVAEQPWPHQVLRGHLHLGRHLLRPRGPHLPLLGQGGRQGRRVVARGRGHDGQVPHLHDVRHRIPLHGRALPHESERKDE